MRIRYRLSDKYLLTEQLPEGESMVFFHSGHQLFFPSMFQISYHFMLFFIMWFRNHCNEGMHLTH